MDASNPIQDSTRVTLAGMKEKAIRQRRQNLELLSNICSGLKRNAFEVPPLLDDVEGRAKRVAEIVSTTVSYHKLNFDEHNKNELLEVENLKTFLNVHDPFPVCGILRDGVPYIPLAKTSPKGM